MTWLQSRHLEGFAFDGSLHQAAADGFHAHADGLHLAVNDDLDALQVGLEGPLGNTGHLATDATQVFRLAQSGVPTVYEFSCSPLTSRLSKLDRHERANPRLVKELTVEKRNFGSLEFSGYGVERKLIARCFDSNAKLLWEKLIASARFSGSGEPV